MRFRRKNLLLLAIFSALLLGRFFFKVEGEKKSHRNMIHVKRTSIAKRNLTYPHFQAGKELRKEKRSFKVNVSNGEKQKGIGLVHFTKAWFQEETTRMNQVDANPRQTQEYLLGTAHTLTSENIQYLTAVAISNRHSENEKNLAVYLLMNSPNTPIKSLKKIALLPRDKNMGHHSIPVNLTLSFMALDQLQKRAIEDKSVLQEILYIHRHSKNPPVQKLTYDILIAANDGKVVKMGVQ
jgi:hypothetical protein